LQLLEGLPVGGAEQLQVILARYLDTTRYDLRVCSLAPIKGSPIACELRAMGVPVFSFGGVRLRDPRHLLRLAALIRLQRIDVIHTHLCNAHILGALAGALAHRPVVSTLHNLPDAYNSQGSALMDTLQTLALRWGTSRVIACAPRVADDARARLGLPDRKLVVVPNGIDTRAFLHPDTAAARAVRRELLGPHAGPLVLSIGTVRAQKGHQYLVEATPRLLDAFPGLRVVIVGPANNNQATVQECIDRLDLGGRVLLAGERLDIPELLAAADLFVLPSVSEGLPLVLLEALAAGTPAVATLVGGVPGAVEDGVTARLVPPADAGALADAMLEVLQHPDAARRRAEAGRAHVQATYGGEVWAERLQAIFSQVARSAS
jgi:glycosyltransferase involved in cell wall biosynthesis